VGEVVYEQGVPIDGADSGGIARALEQARAADVVVLCLGEAAPMSGEAASRAHPELPGQQRALAEEVLALGKKVVVVLFAGRPLIVPWLIEKADAVLMAWFLGEQAGPALADLLTGKVSPSGRLPVTWPRAVGQLPLFFAQYPTGRPFNANEHYTSKYLDEANTPLFAFGHGLTYGDFSISDLKVNRSDFGPSDTLEISASVTNKGSASAQETVFLFTHDLVASVARPVLELKGFAKITLDPGARATVSLTLAAQDLRFLGQDLQPVLEAGSFEILVGPNANRDEMLATTVTLRLPHT